MTPHLKALDHHGRSPRRDATRSIAGEGAGRALLFKPYAAGDWVVPTDLPRTFVCRVTESHPVGGTMLQVLELRPFEGPWPRGTRLVRGSDWVRPAVTAEVAALRRRRARLTRERRRRRSLDHPAPSRLFPKSTQSSSRTPTGTPIR